MSAASATTESAAHWRDSLLDVDRLALDDALITRIDALPPRLRGRVIAKLDHALRLGVSDRRTLVTVMEAITSDR